MASTTEPPVPDHPERPNPKPGSARRQRSSSGRISGGLVGLSAAAIVAIYGAGYLNTDASTPANLPLSVVASPATATPTATPTAAPTVAPSIPARRGRSELAPATSPTPAPTQPAAVPSSRAAAGLRDGSYTAAGTSRHGNIEATLVVAGGRVVSAEITSCQTRYPCSRVASLVSQVVANQAAPVNHVSGATDSSNAYRQAVAAALAKAAQG